MFADAFDTRLKPCDICGTVSRCAADMLECGNANCKLFVNRLQVTREACRVLAVAPEHEEAARTLVVQLGMRQVMKDSA